MEILLIDDDQNILKRVQKTFKEVDSGIRCSVANSCEQGLEMFKLHQFDLVMVDMKFPKMDGLTLIKTLRHSKITTPIIVISGTAEIQEKIRALDLGADDYILKPFDQQELVARVKRHIFRSNNHCNNKFVVGPLLLDIETKVVTITDINTNIRVVKLTNKEYQLLEILILKKGITISKYSLLKQLYGASSGEPDAKIIDVLMCKIRKKIAEYTNESLIITSWGRGYSVKDDSPKGTLNNHIHMENKVMAASMKIIF